MVARTPSAGRYDRRVLLERIVTTRDAFNENEKNWTDLATVWASKVDVSDAERIRNAEVGATITTRFRIRWSTDVADLSALDRLKCEGRTYEISGVKEIGRREELEITAAARNDGGLA